MLLSTLQGTSLFEVPCCNWHPCSSSFVRSDFSWNLMWFWSPSLPHNTKYRPMITTTAPSILNGSYINLEPSKPLCVCVGLLKVDITLWWLYLPMCSLSPRRKYDCSAVNTAPRGLNMVTKTGPLCSVHHSWMKIVIPEHTTPCHLTYKTFKTSFETKIIIWNSFTFFNYCIYDGPEVNAVECNGPCCRFVLYEYCEGSWLCSTD